MSKQGLFTTHTHTHTHTRTRTHTHTVRTQAVLMLAPQTPVVLMLTSEMAGLIITEQKPWSHRSDLGSCRDVMGLVNNCLRLSAHTWVRCLITHTLTAGCSVKWLASWGECYGWHFHVLWCRGLLQGLCCTSSLRGVCGGGHEAIPLPVVYLHLYDNLASFSRSYKFYGCVMITWIWHKYSLFLLFLNPRLKMLLTEFSWCVGCCIRGSC